MSAVRPTTQSVTRTPAGRALLIAALAIAIIGAIIGATEPIRAVFQATATERLVTVTPGAVLFASNVDVLSVTLVITGVLLLLFGITFRHGHSLAEEAEGLV
jgi:uncharacterized membrane protein